MEIIALVQFKIGSIREVFSVTISKNPLIEPPLISPTSQFNHY